MAIDSSDMDRDLDTNMEDRDLTDREDTTSMLDGDEEGEEEAQ